MNYREFNDYEILNYINTHKRDYDKIVATVFRNKKNSNYSGNSNGNPNNNFKKNNNFN